jgi:hypothetical protein
MGQSANTLRLKGVSRLHVLSLILYVALVVVAAGVALAGWMLYKHLGSGGSL